MVDEEQASRAERFGAGVGIVGVVLLALAILTVLGLLAALAIVFLWQALMTLIHDSQSVFDFLGDHLASLGGWAAALVAAVSASVLAWTNVTRAREATNNDFRDFMQWALEHLGEDEPDSVKMFAFRVVAQFAEAPPGGLSGRNRALAMETLEKLVPDSSESEVVAMPTGLDTRQQKEGGRHEQGS